MKQMLIKNAAVFTDNKIISADVAINHGKIEKINQNISGQFEMVLNASGMVLAPGLVDIHVHLREPGFEYKEDILSGSKAAAAGGFTTIACMPNTRPVIDDAEKVQWIIEKSKNTGYVNVLPVAALSIGQKGEEAADIKALKNAGAVALSDDGLPVMNAALLRQVMQEAKALDLPVISHCEDAHMTDRGVINEGAVSKRLNLPGRPAIAEELMVARDAMLARETGAHVHIAHVSTKHSVEIIRRAKAEGVYITCETCPQYFTFTEEEVIESGSLAKVNPPLRTGEDVAAIIQGLADGTIDAIVTDHAPHSMEEKAQDLLHAPSGMSGLETALAAALTMLVHGGELTLEQLLMKMTSRPADIIGCGGGRLYEGEIADLVLFDPKEEWVVNPEEFYSKGKNTPFGGKKLKGRVCCTILGGEITYRRRL